MLNKRHFLIEVIVFSFFIVIIMSTVDKGLGPLVPRNVLCDFEIHALDSDL